MTPAEIGIAGLAYTIIGGVCYRINDRQRATEKELADFREDVALRYVRSPEMTEVKLALNQLRSDVTHGMERLSTELAALSKDVHQLIGQRNNR